MRGEALWVRYGPLNILVILPVQSFPDRAVIPVNTTPVWFDSPPLARRTLATIPFTSPGWDTDPPLVGASPVVNPPARRGFTSLPARHDLLFCRAAGRDSRPFGHRRPTFSLEAMAAGKVAFFALLGGYVPWSFVLAINLKEGSVAPADPKPATPRGSDEARGYSFGGRAMFDLLDS